MPHKIKQEEIWSTLLELAHVLNNLRYFTKEWEMKYGVELKMAKKRWENRADELLRKLELPEIRLSVKQMEIQKEDGI